MLNIIAKKKGVVSMRTDLLEKKEDILQWISEN
jgi:hypothetical protein